MSTARSLGQKKKFDAIYNHVLNGFTLPGVNVLYHVAEASKLELHFVKLDRKLLTKMNVYFRLKKLYRKNV